MKPFCCSVLSDTLYSAGQKGYSVIPAEMENKKGDYYFIFQFRSADQNQTEGRLIVNEVAIKYCPWCGTKLSSLMESFREEIQILAKKNEHLTIKI